MLIDDSTAPLGRQATRRNRVRPAGRRYTCLDLFCGAGGLSEGFRQAGFTAIAGNDVDPWAGATYTDNHKKYGTKFVLGDISKPSVKEELVHYARQHQIDVVSGGPPCQAFSQVRNHARIIDDPRNSLYRHFVEVLSLIRPKFFVMENVPGLENLAGGAIRNQIIEDLALDGGYRVESRVLDAAAFGVPQNRARVVFIGVRVDLKHEPPFPIGVQGELPALDRVPGVNGFRYKHPKNTKNPNLSWLLDPECTKLVTVEQAIGDLIHLRPNPKLVRRPSNESISYEIEPNSAYQRDRRASSSALFNADVPSIREDTVARLRAIPQGGNFRDLPEELCARYLNGKKWGPELGRGKLSRKYFFAYRKLHPQHFSWTLNTKADCVYHYSRARALTVREFARVHSFDDNYLFLNGDRHSRYRQIGNAVPPLFARAIAESIAEVLKQLDAAESHPILAAE